MTFSKVGVGATPRPWKAVPAWSTAWVARSETPDCYLLMNDEQEAHGVGKAAETTNIEDAILIVTAVNEREALLKIERSARERIDVAVDETDGLDGPLNKRGEWACLHDSVSREEAGEKGIADDWLCDNCGAAFSPFIYAVPLRSALLALSEQRKGKR